MPATANSSASARSPITPLLAANTKGAEPITLSFDEPRIDTPRPISISGRSRDLGSRVQLAKYVTGIKDEAFIGPLPNSLRSAINLLKAECPSLHDVDAHDITLNLHAEVVPGSQQGGFRILASAWPAAVSDSLPLLKVDIKGKGDQAPPSPPGTAQGLKVTFPEASPVSDLNVDADSLKGSRRFRAHSINLAYHAPVSWKELCEDSSNTKTWDDLVREGALLGI